MKEIEINATLRPESGKGSARQARIAGNIPAVMYGPETDPIGLSIDARAFRNAMKSTKRGTSLINLGFEGKSNKVILREIQRDPVTSKVIHIDFLAVSMTKPITISVPIDYVGIPVGVKTDGGIMQVTMREVEISCLPSDIPENIEVNVEKLGIGDSVHIRDLKIENAKILAEARRTMVVISAPTVIKATAAEEAAALEEAEGVVAETAEGAEGAEGEAADGEKKD